MFTLEEMLSKRNQRDAFEHFKSKKNGAGADGMLLSELENYWRLNKDRISDELSSGKYEPGLVKCTEIVNNKGKRRVISNLTTIDRFISRLLAQKLRRYLEPVFLSNSFAYQTDKGLLEAVNKALEFVTAENDYLVEIDLKDYFDNIPHDALMDLVRQQIKDERVCTLIYKYVHCKVIIDEKIEEKEKGIVQGNSISPVLSNLFLHSLDTFLESSGFNWLRFADNIYIYCADENSASEIYNKVREFIGSKLSIPVNEKKSGVYISLERNILGYEFHKAKGTVTVKKVSYKKYNNYHKWHESALERVNNEYHIVQGGVLNKRDYSLLFENEEEKHDLPASIVDHITMYSEVTIASSALRMASERNIRISFVDKYGNLLGDYLPAGHGKTSTIFLKQAVFYQSADRLVMAKRMEKSILHNMRANLRYYNKKMHNTLEEPIESISDYMQEIDEKKSVNELLLVEARAKQLYYSAFNCFLKQDGFFFEKRSKRPPMDEINALISFGNVAVKKSRHEKYFF